MFSHFSDTLEAKNAVNTDVFCASEAPNHGIYDVFFASGSKNHAIYNVFWPVPSKNTGIYAVFTLLQDVVSTCKKDKHTVNVFASRAQQKIVKTLLKNGQKSTSKSIL